VGYNALYACRASIGEDSRGDLYVTWEQFDSANVEPITSFLRADIFAAASEDGGQSWLPAVKLTDAGTSSLRFASVIDRMVPGEPETLLVRYMSDPVAGFYVQSQGPATICPIIVQKLPVSDLGVGIAEAGESGPWRPELRVSPTLFHDGTTIRVSLPRAEQAAVRIFDALGREVRQFPAGPSRVSSLTWNGCDETGRRLSPGVYVVRLVGAGREVSRKVVLTGPRQ
jgi:hypothetical protein